MGQWGGRSGVWRLIVTGLPVSAATLTGRVVRVSDGDTLTLRVADGAGFQPVRIRLTEIDAPESRQPYPPIKSPAPSTTHPAH